MPADVKCPDIEVLQQLSLGQLSAADAWPIERHLIRCRGCAQAVQSLRDAAILISSHPAMSGFRSSEVLPSRSTSSPLGKAAAIETVASAAAPRTPPPETRAPAPSLPSQFGFLSPAQEKDELGRLGHYRVLKVLGSGGMGIVFQAQDLLLKRAVALKVMRPEQAADETARKRFLREGEAAASLSHDHIVTIYQVGEERGIPFLAMQLLQGESLDERLKNVGKLLMAEVLRIGREAAEGLAAAHERGLIHRDIKPGNIWLERIDGLDEKGLARYRVKILDFGLARAVGDNAQHLTQTGYVVGTPSFMSPEQARGTELDGRSDLFSLGCVLYQACTGKEPFRGTDVMSTLMALATDEPTPIRQLNPEVAPALAEQIGWLMAKSPHDRPRSGQVVAQNFARLEREGPVVPNFLRNPLPGAMPARLSGSLPPPSVAGSSYSSLSSGRIPVGGVRPVAIAVAAVGMVVAVLLFLFLMSYFTPNMPNPPSFNETPSRTSK